MRIAVSNLLWTRDQDEAVAALLNRRGVDAIDIAPTRYFEDVTTASPADWRRVSRFWGDRGIAVTGMQSLLHGTTGLSIFGDAGCLQRTRAHLRTVMRIGAELGAVQLVFGSQQKRDRGPLTEDQALDSAAGFFAELAADACRLGVCLTVEPVSERYGNNFLVNHEQAAALVDRVASPGFRLTLDIGCVVLAGEDVVDVVRRHERRISHVHLAEDQLVPLHAGNPVHAVAGPAAARGLPGRVACIEALRPPEISSLDAIAQSLDIAQGHYG